MMEPIAKRFEDVQGMHLIVALSGGSDSVALLTMLCECAEALKITLTCVHVEHGLRGKASLQDAAFCEALCKKLNVPIQVIHVNVPDEAIQTGEGVETAARRLRHQALERVRRELSADRIALAHHLNDQAETVLMHLLRGSGIKGAGGMLLNDGRLYRPLLDLTKQELEEYLLKRNQTWCTDQTNRIADTPRNALRLSAIPALEAIYPNAQKALARFAQCAQAENRLMETLTEAFLNAHLESGIYGIRILKPEEADEAIFRRAAMRLFADSLDFEKLTALSDLAKRDRGRCDINGDCFALRTPNAIYFLNRNPVLPEPVPLSLSGNTELLPLGTMSARPAPARPIAEKFRQVLNADALSGAVLRTRQPGDRIRPLGCGEKSLSDYMIDRKLDRPLRDFVPLVARGQQVLWVVGCGISEDAKLKTSSDRAVMLDWIENHCLGGNNRE